MCTYEVHPENPAWTQLVQHGELSMHFLLPRARIVSWFNSNAVALGDKFGTFLADQLGPPAD